MADGQGRVFNYGFWFALIGFLFGLTGVIFATLIAMVMAGVPLTLQNFIQVHLASPLKLFVDLLPFLLAALMGYLGSRERKYQEMLRNSASASQHVQTSLQQHDAEQERLDQERRQLEQRLSQSQAEVKALQTELAESKKHLQQPKQSSSRGKRQWDAAFDAFSDLILLADASERVMRCNRAALSALNLNYPDIIGHQLRELFYGEKPSTGAAGEAPEGQPIEADLPQEPFPTSASEVVFPKLMGWHQVTSAPMEVEPGQPGMVYILHNVTDRVEFTLDLKSQKLYYQALVKNIPVAVATLKLDRRIVDCNPAFEALFGYTLEEVKGRSLDPLITPPDKLEASPARLDSIAPGEFIREVIMRRRKDGSLVEVEAYRVPVTMRGKRIAILCLYYDISRLGLTRQPPIEPLEQADLSPAMTELPSPGAESLLAEPLQVTAPQSEAVEMVKAAPTRRGRSPKASLPETRQLEEEPGTPSAAGYEVNRIEGIGPAYAKRLTEVGITTTADLLAACLTRDGRTQLSEQTGISTNLLLVWASRADLMRVPGVGAEYCDLLDASGVDTSEELRVRNPEILHQTLLEVNQTWQLTKRNPTLAEVSDWIAAAKNIDVFISY